MSAFVEKVTCVVKYQQEIYRQMDDDEEHQEQPGDTHQKLAANRRCKKFAHNCLIKLVVVLTNSGCKCTPAGAYYKKQNHCKLLFKTILKTEGSK
jgi:hypothetical protein